MTDQPRITIDISPGELADRYTIAQLKVERITEADKAPYVVRDADYLGQLRERMLGCMVTLQREQYLKLEVQLGRVNAKLWGYEDRIRDNREVNKDPKGALAIARNIHMQNDARYGLKVKINRLLRIDTLEQKSYNYGSTS